MALLEQTVSWLRDHGSDQWSTWRSWPEKLRTTARNGETWLLLDGATLVGTITVEIGHGDPEFWAATEQRDAAFLSKLAIRRDYAGQELGHMLLNWARGYAYRQGMRWARLDAWRSNQRLHDYYRQLGWTYVRTVELPHRRSGTLFAAATEPVTKERMIDEVATMTLPTTALCWGEPSDPAGNDRPDHTHRGGGTIHYRHAGHANAVWDPRFRYLVCREGGRWVAKVGHPGRWSTMGEVTSAELPLQKGNRYLIEHAGTLIDGCRVTVIEAADE